MNNTFSHGTRELRENLQPATHFIEVYKNGFGINIYNDITPIEDCIFQLYETFSCGLDTIAIFKIREKKPATE